MRMHRQPQTEAARGTRALHLRLIGLSTLAVFAAALLGGVSSEAPSAVAADEPALSPAQIAALYRRPVAEWPRPLLREGAVFQEFAPLQIRARPVGKELEQVRIGQQLFNDPALSASGHFACQSCHNRRLGWGDGLPVSFGHGRSAGKRNAPPLFSAGYVSAFFWDGRAATLQEQAMGPLTSADELANGDLGGIEARVNAKPSYREAFAAITGHDRASLQDVLDALAAFQQTLERRTKFDRFLAGESDVLTEQEIFGLHVFRTKAGCANCHNGPLLTDGRMHNIGLSFFGRKLEDLGRYEVTGNAADAGRFKTPSLRHVSRTGPYMHNGIFPQLRGIVRFYEGGGGRVLDRHRDPERVKLYEAARTLSPLLKSFELTREERDALVAFLNVI